MLKLVRQRAARAVESGWPLWIAVFLAVIWHIRNQGWPNDDAANYMTTAYQIFGRFRDAGPAAGLAAMLDLRGWRPTVFPVLATPYLLLFHGNILAAVAGAQCTLYAVFVVFSRRLCGMFLSRGRATAAAAATATAPYLCLFSTIFFSELAWVCFSTLFLYFAFRSNGFKDIRNSALAGGMLGMALMVRPAESVAVMGIPVLCLLGDAFYRRTLRIADMAFPAILAGASAALLVGSLLTPALSRSRIWLIFFLLAACCAAIGARSRGRLSTGHLSFWLAGACLCVFWWAGFMTPLYNWAQTTSFGEMAKVTTAPRQAHATAIRLFGGILMFYGLFQLCLLSALAGAAAVYRRVRRGAGDEAKAGAVPSMTTFFCVAAGSVLPIFALYWLTGTGDPRRPMVGVTFLLMALSIAALRAPRPLSRVTVPLVVCVAVFQGCLAAAGAIGDGVSNPALSRWFGQGLPRPHEDRDRNEDAVELLSSRVPRGSRVAVYTEALFKAPDRLYEPAALQLAAEKRRGPITVGYLWDDGQYDSVVRRLATSGFEYLLLDSLDDPTVRQSHMPYVHFAAALLDRVRGNGATPGLRVAGTFPLDGRNQTLFELTEAAKGMGLPADPALTAYGGNAASARAGARPMASDQSRGYPVEFLNDDSEEAWGSTETSADTYAGVALPRPEAIGSVRIVLFSPADRAHLRDISVVCADSNTGGAPDWRIVRSRIAGKGAFGEKVTIPKLADRAAVDIEIDPGDRNGSAHRMWGIACLSGSRGYLRNYLPVGAGVYLRELQMRERPPR